MLWEVSRGPQSSKSYGVSRPQTIPYRIAYYFVAVLVTTVSLIFLDFAKRGSLDITKIVKWPFFFSFDKNALPNS